MDFIDNIHLVFQMERRETRLFEKRSHIVDARVGRGVHFNDIDRFFFLRIPAGLANPARLAILRRKAVNGARKYLRYACFSSSREPLKRYA